MPFARRLPHKEPADTQVVQRARVRIGDQIRGLLHAVVQESVADPTFGRVGVDVLVAAIKRLDQSRVKRRPQDLLGLPWTAFEDQREHIERETAADRRRQLQRTLRHGRQAADFIDQQFDDVVGVVGLLNRGKVPLPAVIIGAVAQVICIVDRAKELVEKKWVAAGLGEAQPGQRGTISRRHAHGRRHDACYFRLRQRAQHQRQEVLATRQQPVAQCDQGMKGSGVVVAIGADEKHVTLVARGHELLDHPERGRIGPLQVVEEQHQRAIGGREHVDETRERTVQSKLSLFRCHRGDRLCGPHDQRQLGNQFDHHAQAIAQARAQPQGPLSQRCLGPTEQLPHQFLEGVDQRCVWDVAPELVGFACQKAAAPGNDRFLHLVHHR